MSLYLNNSQALAVHQAMCELNNVSAHLWTRMPVVASQEWVDVKEDDTGAIHVRRGPLRRFDPTESVVMVGSPVEYHASQGAFALAYGIK